MKIRSLRQIRESLLRRHSLPDDVEAINTGTASIRANQTGQDLDRGAFAGAIRSDQESNLAGRCLEREGCTNDD